MFDEGRLGFFMCKSWKEGLLWDITHRMTFVINAYDDNLAYLEFASVSSRLIPQFRNH